MFALKYNDSNRKITLAIFFFSFRFFPCSFLSLSRAQCTILPDRKRKPSIPRSTRSSCIYIQLRKPIAAVNSSKFISIRVLWPTIIIQFILSIECFLWYIFFFFIVFFFSTVLCCRFVVCSFRAHILNLD